MSSNKQSPSPRESSMNASDATIKADIALNAAGSQIAIARKQLAAAEKKYQERLKGRPK